MRSIPISPKPMIERTGDELDLLQILNTLRLGKWRILSWMVLMVVLAIYYAYFVVTPLYTTTATVALQHRSEKVVDLASPISALGGDNYTINTETEVIASRELVSQLVDKLNLVADPVFNYDLRPQDGSWSPSQAIGVVRTWIEILIRPTTEIKPPLTPAEIRENVISKVQESITTQNIKGSYVFNIRVTTDDPVASARLANGLADIYLEDQVTMKYKATEQATIWLNSRVGELGLELEAAENAVKTFVTGSELIGEEALTALNRQLKDRRERIVEAKAAAAVADTYVKTLKIAKTGGDPKQMAIAANNTTLNQIIVKLDVEGAREAFDTRFDLLLERAQLEALQASEKTAALERSVVELAKQVERQSAELLKLRQLEREAAASRQIYEYFLGRLKEISVQQGVHRADSRILSRALVPENPSKPRKLLIVMGAMFLGFCIGGALVLLREQRHNGFRSAQDLEQAIGLTVLAQIPQAPVSKRKRLLSYLEAKPTSAFVESVRDLRTSVMLSNLDHPARVIMMTSSLPGEGKTTQSLALAHSFANMGKRVLLIEGDIRRRTLQQYFRTRHKFGLVSVVSGAVALEEAILFNDKLGIDILLGEKSTINSADFFSSARFRTFLDEIRSAYDVIVIDTPPILVLSDPRVIGQMVDAIVYVVRWNMTTQSQVEAGVKALTSVDLKVLGFTLSQINMREAKGYGGQYGEIYDGYGSKYYRN